MRSVKRENSRTKRIELDARMPAEPGQFAMLWLPGLDERPFSVLGEEPLSFAVAAVGPFSRALHRLEPGASVWLRGPFGRGFRPAGHDHLLVGGGYGMAPLSFLARRLATKAGRVRAVAGARTAEELLLVDDCGAAGAEISLVTEDGSAGSRGLVTDVAGSILATDPPATVYACGPHGMLEALEALCATHGVPAQLSWEAYMRCGIGLCGSCEHRGRLVCAEGPVLDRADQQ